MSISSGFFDAIETVNPDNSVTYDREYLSAQFAKYFALFISNGVFGNITNCLKVMQNSTANMGVRVKLGYGWINGYWVYNDSDYSISVDAADASLNRKDIIVVGLDLTSRQITIYLKKGTLSTSAVAPALQRDNLIYEIELAEIAINAGIVSISDAAITDKRLDTTACGLVTGLINQVPTTDLYNQIQSDLAGFKSVSEQDFNDWFTQIKGKLTTDIAGSLQTQIDNHVNNSAIHVTDTDKTKWNGAVQGITFGHTTPTKDANNNIAIPFGLLDNRDIVDKLGTSGSPIDVNTILAPGCYAVNDFNSNSPWDTGFTVSPAFNLYVMPLDSAQQQGTSSRMLQIGVRSDTGEVRSRVVTVGGSATPWLPQSDDGSDVKHFTKYPDGRLHEWGFQVTPITVTSAYGNMFLYSHFTIGLLNNCVSNVSAHVNIVSSGALIGVGATLHSGTQNVLDFNVLSPVSVSNLTATFMYDVWSRWKA